jgi:hypothetical protein
MRRDAVAYAILTLLTLIFAAAPTSAFGQFRVLSNFGSASGDPRNPTYSGTIAQGRDATCTRQHPRAEATAMAPFSRSRPTGLLPYFTALKALTAACPQAD